MVLDMSQTYSNIRCPLDIVISLASPLANPLFCSQSVVKAKGKERYVEFWPCCVKWGDLNILNIFKVEFKV